MVFICTFKIFIMKISREGIPHHNHLLNVGWSVFFSEGTITSKHDVDPMQGGWGGLYSRFVCPFAVSMVIFIERPVLKHRKYLNNGNDPVSLCRKNEVIRAFQRHLASCRCRQSLFFDEFSTAKYEI